MADIMTAGEFKKASYKFIGRRNNPIIVDLDKLLDLYHRSGGNPRRQLKILCLIYIWCKQYQFWGGKRGGVAELEQQARLKLQQPNQELTLTLAHQGARFKDGKMSVPGDNAKSMGKGYQMEPMLPGKGNVGGTTLQHNQKRINTPALRALFEDKIEAGFQDQAVKTGQSYTMQDVIRAAEEAMATAPIAEFLDIYFNFTNSPAAAARADFEYCDKAQRQQYRVYISNNGLFYKNAQLNEPYTTDQGPSSQDWGLYAMDINRGLYVKPQRDVTDGAFNHSSFLSGKPAICAGAIEIDVKGQLRSISNESGHYRPNRGDLVHILLIFRDEYNVDLTLAEVVDGSAKGKPKSNAFQFLNANMGALSSRLNDF